MDNSRMLTGEQLVAKGVTRVDAALPEIGFKEVIASNTWLEEKQVQSALHARKHLVKVERIEKNSNLSHAKWISEMGLAEVTQKVGSHWQYLGHNVSKTLYLLPEETLFMMELGCLLLKHNEVTVSLQKAYALCLTDFSLDQYRVYASLSRVGYKVFRHKIPVTKCDDKSNCMNTVKGLDDKRAKEFNDSSIEKPSFSNTVAESSSLTQDIQTLENNNEAITQSIDNLPLDSNIDEKENVIPVNTKPSKMDVDNNCSASRNIENVNENKVCDTDNCEEIDGSDISPHATEVSEVNNEVIIVKHTNDSAKSPSLQKSNTQENRDNTNEVLISQSGDAPINDNENIGTENVSEKIIPENTKPSEMDVDDCTDAENKENLKKNEVSNAIEKCRENDCVNTGIVPENIAKEATELNNANDIAKSSSLTESIETQENRENINDDPLVPSPNAAMNDIKNKATENVSEGMFTQINQPNKMDEDDTCNETVAQYIGNKNEMRNDLENSRDDLQNGTITETSDINTKLVSSCQTNIEKLNLRKLSTRKCDVHDYFRSFPDCTQGTYSVQLPNENYLPRNIFLHNSKYVLNAKAVSTKDNTRQDDAPTPNTSIRSNVGEMRQITASESTYLTGLHRPSRRIFQPTIRPNQQPFQRFYKHAFSPPRAPYMFYNFNMRPFLQNVFSVPRFHYPFGMNFQHRAQHYHCNTIPHCRRRTVNSELKNYHRVTILNIAEKFKNLPTTAHANLDALLKLIRTYNLQYNEKLVLTPELDIITDVPETINLDDDEESAAKRPRLTEDRTYQSNLNRLETLADKLRDLERRKQSNSRYRRVFSNAIRTFNKSFKADYYMNSEFKLVDRQLITVDSSSDSDIKTDVSTSGSRKRRKKKLRNPFNIFKRLSEAIQPENVNEGASTSTNETVSTGIETIESTDMDNKITKMLNNVPSKNTDSKWATDDFGKPTICSRENSSLLEFNDEYLLEFSKLHSEIENWVELKISYLENIKDNITMMEDQAKAQEFIVDDCRVKPLIGPSDSLNKESMLQKLRIISTSRDVNYETNFQVVFDVYNRDLQDFMKTNPPTPHFRIVCSQVSSEFPSGSDIAALQGKYKDDVPIVFAFVDTSSVSYLVISHVDTPVYLPCNDLW